MGQQMTLKAWMNMNDIRKGLSKLNSPGRDIAIKICPWVPQRLPFWMLCTGSSTHWCCYQTAPVGCGLKGSFLDTNKNTAWKEAENQKMQTGFVCVNLFRTAFVVIWDSTTLAPTRRWHKLSTSTSVCSWSVFMISTPNLMALCAASWFSSHKEVVSKGAIGLHFGICLGCVLWACTI